MAPVWVLQHLTGVSKILFSQLLPLKLKDYQGYKKKDLSLIH